MRAYISFIWRFLFLLRGRVSRSAYGIFLLICFGLGGVMNVKLIHSTTWFLTAGALWLFSNPIFAYPWFCVAVKRLHDMGRGGIWVLSPLLLPVLAIAYLIFALSIPSVQMSDADMRAVAFGGPWLVIFAYFIGCVIFNLWLLLGPGQAKNNRFDVHSGRLGPLRQPSVKN